MEDSKEQLLSDILKRIRLKEKVKISKMSYKKISKNLKELNISDDKINLLT